jgi:serine/threonine protein kinase
MAHLKNYEEDHEMNFHQTSNLSSLHRTDPSRSCSEDFEEITRVGSGSFGTVMKVRRIQDGGIYVIKSVKINELSKKEQLEAINEVDLLAKMNSFYVVKYHDSFIEKGCLRIVMEFCNKGDLQRMIKRAQKKELESLGEYTTWHIILQVSSSSHSSPPPSSHSLIILFLLFFLLSVVTDLVRSSLSS